MQAARVGAVVVVRLDRLARSLAQLANLGEELRALGVELVSLSEGLDPSTPTGRPLFGMCGVFSALEVDLLRERTRNAETLIREVEPLPKRGLLRELQDAIEGGEVWREQIAESESSRDWVNGIRRP